jgi:hypothetical protein
MSGLKYPGKGAVMSTPIQALDDRLCSLVAATRIVPPAALAREGALYHSKWFAYRFMTPVEATLLFGARYVVERQAYIRRNVDRDTSERATPFRFTCGLPSRPNGLFTKLWEARQFADRLTIPYEMYLTFCFRFAEARTRRCAPQPEQLKPTAASEAVWRSELEKFIEAEFDFWVDRAEFPEQLRIEAFHRHPAQLAFREFVVDYVHQRPVAWHISLGRWSVQKSVVPVRAFVTGSHRAAIQAAIPRLRADLNSGLIARPGKLEGLSAHDLFPTCFSVPFAYDAAASVCASCPFASACQKGGSVVAAHAGVNLTTNDPDGDRKRRLTNARVKKHRANKKRAGTPEGLIQNAIKKYAPKRRVSPGTCNVT